MFPITLNILMKENCGCEWCILLSQDTRLTNSRLFDTMMISKPPEGESSVILGVTESRCRSTEILHSSTTAI